MVADRKQPQDWLILLGATCIFHAGGQHVWSDRLMYPNQAGTSLPWWFNCVSGDGCPLGAICDSVNEWGPMLEVNEG
jgi:hypothetical protein